MGEVPMYVLPHLVGSDGFVGSNPLGPLGSSSSQHRRTLELILQEGSAFFQASNPRSERTDHCRRNSAVTGNTADVSGFS